MMTTLMMMMMMMMMMRVMKFVGSSSSFGDEHVHGSP